MSGIGSGFAVGLAAGSGMIGVGVAIGRKAGAEKAAEALIGLSERYEITVRGPAGEAVPIETLASEISAAAIKGSTPARTRTILLVLLGLGILALGGVLLFLKQG